MTPAEAADVAFDLGCVARPLRDAPHLEPWGWRFERRLSTQMVDPSKPVTPESTVALRYSRAELEAMEQAEFADKLAALT